MNDVYWSLGTDVLAIISTPIIGAILALVVLVIRKDKM